MPIRHPFPATIDAGLLVLRLGLGLTLLGAHGWRKLAGYPGLAAQFPDPYGLGTSLTLGLAIVAEVVGAALVAVGLFTRWAAIPPLALLTTAFFVVHRADPFARKELALLYGVGFLAILLAGPGRWSLDAALEGRRARRRVR